MVKFYLASNVLLRLKEIGAFIGRTSLFFTFFLFAYLNINAQIFSPDGLRMPGDWNSFANSNGMGGPFDFSQTSTGTPRWRTTFQFTGSTGSQNFKFVSGNANPWVNQWADRAFTINTELTNLPFCSNCSPPNNSVSLTNNRWYTVNWRDNAYATTSAIFMETESNPVTFTNISRSPAGNPTPMQTVDITVIASSSLSASERVFVYYTTNNFSSVRKRVEVLFSGNTGVATIPGFADGTYVQYYIISSSINLADNETNQYYWMRTIRHSVEYNYTVTNAPVPAITGFSPSTGFSGSTITINGSNFTGATAVTFGGIPASTFSVVNANQITAVVAAGGSGSISVTTPNGTGSLAGFTFAGYTSQLSGDWNTAATWLGGLIPPSNANVTINNSVTVNNTVVNSYNTINITSSNDLSFGASGSLQALNLLNGGTLNMVLGGTMQFANNSSFANSGTFNAGIGTIFFNGNGIVSGAATAFNHIIVRNGGINFGIGISTVNGTLEISSGGFVNTNPPTFGSNSSLRYATNGSYTTGVEWPATNGPSNILVDSSTTVLLNFDRSLTGSLNVQSGTFRSLGARTLTMNGSSQTIFVNTLSGSISGTDVGSGNDLSLVIASGLTNISGTASSNSDNERKFFNITVNTGATLALNRGVFCRYGAFTVNGTLQINENGYVQGVPANARAASYGANALLRYNNGGSYTTTTFEWRTTGNTPKNVNISNSGTEVILSSDRTIDNSIVLTDGMLNTASHKLIVGNTATVNENGGRIIGRLETTRNVPLLSNNNFGGIGLSITPNATAMGSTLVARVSGEALSGGQGPNVDNTNNFSIPFYFEVTPTTNAGLNATVVISYFDADISFNENNLVLYKRDKNATNWHQIPSTLDVNNNTISFVVDSFSVLAPGDINAPLPVKWNHISASFLNKEVIIAFSTASEINNSHFEIENSIDGLNWQKIGLLNAYGNSNFTNEYSFEHKNPVIGTNFYRIKQIDFDGLSTYSRIVSVRVVESATFSIFPNPAKQRIQLKGLDNVNGALLQVYTTAGKLVQQLELSQTNPIIELNNLVAGMYLAKVITKDGINFNAWIYLID